MNVCTFKVMYDKLTADTENGEKVKALPVR